MVECLLGHFNFWLIISLSDSLTSGLRPKFNLIELSESKKSSDRHLFQDTTAFLNTIENYKHVLNNTILVTLDVVSLYTNIPHNEAITYICEQYKLSLPSKFDRLKSVSLA